MLNIIDFDGKKHTIQTTPNPDLNLMDVLKDAGFPIGNCGGMALCASCHCYINEHSALNEKSEAEQDMLDQLHNSDVRLSRLICQIPILPKLHGITLIMKS